MSEPNDRPAGVDGLVTEVRGTALWVLFDRPEAYNALTDEMYAGLRDSCERAAEDDSIRSLVISGRDSARPAFATGSDIGQLVARDTWEDFRAYEDGVIETIRRLQHLPVPTVAAVAGPCVGAGATIALSCDVRVIARSTRLGYPVAKTIGGCLPMETYVLMAAHLGTSRALDMLLTARLFDAEELHACGVASRLADDTDLHTVAQTVADRMAAFAPLSLQAAKTAMGRIRDRLAQDWPDDMRRIVYESADFAEGISAFRGGRKPQWSGK